MAVQVMGVAGRDMPGLKAAMKAFQTANKENSDALLNVIDGANGLKGPDGREALTENDPRPPYRHSEFPKMVYHAKFGERIVDGEDDLVTAQSEGYRLQPYQVVKAAVSDPGVEKANLKRELAEKDGQIATLGSEMADLKQQVAELMALLNSDGTPRRPGRPKKDE
jgi:hypothetical protein